MSANLKYCGKCGAENSAKNTLCDECGCPFTILEPKFQVAITDSGPDVKLSSKHQLEKKLTDFLKGGGKLDVICGHLVISFIKDKATNYFELDLGAFDDEDEVKVSHLEAIGYEKVEGRLKMRFTGSISRGDIQNIAEEVDSIFHTIYNIPRVEKYKIKERYNYKISTNKIIVFVLILVSWLLVYNAVTKREIGQAMGVIQPASQIVAANIGEQISVGDFIYKVNDVQLRKSIGDEFLSQTANGLYLIIGLSIINISTETRLIDNDLFKLTDKNNNQFETSIEGGSALVLEGANILYLKQCQPGIQTAGFLVFEVPQKKPYVLHLSGGFGNREIAKVSIN